MHLEMFSGTLMQLLVLLLSAHWQMEALTYYDFYDGGGGGGADFVGGDCQSSADIVRWINEQVVRNAKLSGFNRRLGNILNMMNYSSSARDAHCCFYEKDAIGKIMEDITSLSAKSGVVLDRPLVATGDLGQDLDLILDKMRYVVGNKSQECCVNLMNTLMEYEKDLQTRMNVLNDSLIEHQSSMAQKMAKISEEQDWIEKRMDEFQPNITVLQQKQEEINEALQKCCRELNERVENMRNISEKAQEEADQKAKELEEEIHRLDKIEEEHENKIGDLAEASESNYNIIEELMEGCKNCCVTDEGTIKVNGTELSEKIDVLESQVGNLTEKLSELSNMSSHIEQCESMKAELEKLGDEILDMKLNPPQNDFNCSAIEGLKEEIAKAHSCCEKIDTLTNETQKMHEKIGEMSNICNDQSLALNVSIMDIQNQLKDAMEKINAIGNSTSCDNATASYILDERIQVLQRQVEGLIGMLRVTTDKLDNNAKRIEQLQMEINMKATEIEELLENRLTQTNKIKSDMEERIKRLEKKVAECSSDIDSDLVNRLKQLENEVENIRNHMNKMEQLISRIDEMEKQLAQGLKAMDGLAKEFSECTAKCKEIEKYNELIDRIDKLEKKTTAAGPTTQHTTPMATTTTKTTTPKPPRKRPTRRKGGTLVGIYGSVDNAIPIYN